MRALNKAYPDDSDIAALYAASYMSIGRWDYWDRDGNPRADLQVAEALEHIMAKDLSNPGVLHLHVHLIEAQWSPNARWYPLMLWKLQCPGGHICLRTSTFAWGNTIRPSTTIRSMQVDQQFAKASVLY